MAAPRTSFDCRGVKVGKKRWGGGGLVGVVRVGCEIYAADTVQQLRAIVERLERDEGAKK